ncbi:hypothetical protein [Lysobacter olei]
MATKTQRIKAVADALLNTTATNAKIDRLGRALAARMGRIEEYEAADAAGKASIAVEELRRHLVGMVREYDEIMAARAANGADAEFAETH